MHHYIKLFAEGIKFKVISEPLVMWVFEQNAYFRIILRSDRNGAMWVFARVFLG